MKERCILNEQGVSVNLLFDFLAERWNSGTLAHRQKSTCTRTWQILLYYSTGSNCFFYSENRQDSKRGLLLLLFSLRFIHKVTNINL